MESGSFFLLVTLGIAFLGLLMARWGPGNSKAEKSRGNRRLSASLITICQYMKKLHLLKFHSGEQMGSFEIP